MKAKTLAFIAVAFYLLAVGASEFTAWGAERLERPARLEVSEPWFNMGTLRLGQTGRYRLRLSNTSSTPLVIQQVKPG